LKLKIEFMKSSVRLAALIAAFSLTGCATVQPALKDAFKEKFLVGAALNEAQFTGQNAAETALVKKQFNTITPENILKWEKVHPEPGRYDFAPGDAYVAFGATNKMFVIGHNLIWHEQTPKWVFEDAAGQPVTREILLQRMREHIFAVVGRYRGRIQGWDVVNEALNDDGTLRDSPWRKIIGDDYLAQAFAFAHAADPAAELYYNDYCLENEPKRAGAVALVKKLQAAGVPITGVGVQSHVNLTWPSLPQEEATLAAFGELGLKVMITELDVDVLPKADRNQGADIRRHAAKSRAQSVCQRFARRAAAGARATLRRPVRDFCEAQRHRYARDFLGCDRRQLVAQRLAGRGPHEPSAAVRPRGQTQAGV
jgi:endo-1,4-beta-xylanase